MQMASHCVQMDAGSGLVDGAPVLVDGALGLVDGALGLVDGAPGLVAVFFITESESSAPMT